MSFISSARAGKKRKGHFRSYRSRFTTSFSEPFIGRIVKCFSLYTNVPKILHAKAGRDAVTCVHGIRFLSLTWVVLGHTYNYGIISQDDTFTAGTNKLNALDLRVIHDMVSYHQYVRFLHEIHVGYVWPRLQYCDNTANTCIFSVMSASHFYVSPKSEMDQY